jgi:hypothetical protein
LLLLLLLQYGGPAAQEAAAAAIENLSLDSECEAALAAEGAIEGLLQVLKDGSTAAQVGRKFANPPSVSRMPCVAEVRLF